MSGPMLAMTLQNQCTGMSDANMQRLLHVACRLGMC